MLKLKISLAVKIFLNSQLFLFTKNIGASDKICTLEKEYQMKSIWNFYGGHNSKKSFAKLIFDPSYDINEKDLSIQIRKLKSEGHLIGLHQAFNSWKDKALMEIEKKYVEKSLGEKNKSMSSTLVKI